MGYELSLDEQQQIVSWNILSDGSRRAFYSWPRNAPSIDESPGLRTGPASLLIVPGLGEHGGRYAACAKVFANAGFDVHAIDVLGHGLSPGKRGCIQSYEGLLDEIEVALRAIAKMKPGVPQLLWGHSMGGNLVLNYLLRKKYLPQLAISSGPMLRATRLPSSAFLWLARRLAILMPNYQLQAPVDYAHCTRDPRQREQMMQDKLFHRRLSLRLGAALIDSGQWALEHAGELRTPVLLVHSEQDQITSAQASAEFAKKSPQFCQLKLLADQLHDVHRDLGSESVLDSMCDWLRKNL